MGVKEVFDTLALRYDRWYEEPFGKSAYALEVEAIRKVLSPFGRGLEVGVGTGRFASALGFQFGIDVSFQELRIARQRGVRVVLGDASKMPFPSGVFDAVLIVVSICFFEDPHAVLMEVRRVMGRGGQLILGLVLKDSPWAKFYMEKGQRGHPFYSIARFYSLSEIWSMLSQTGFTVRDVVSTLITSPRDDIPVGNDLVLNGFHPMAGFTVVKASL